MYNLIKKWNSILNINLSINNYYFAFNLRILCTRGLTNFGKMLNNELAKFLIPHALFILKRNLNIKFILF